LVKKYDSNLKIGEFKKLEKKNKKNKEVKQIGTFFLIKKAARDTNYIVFLPRRELHALSQVRLSNNLTQPHQDISKTQYDKY
jgi:hypothetical protein